MEHGKNYSLIEKWKTVGAPSSFRAICLLDVIGKLYEHMMKELLEKELESRRRLSENQFSFRRERCTVQAVEPVLKIASGILDKWGLIVSSHKRNAFNCAKWSFIIEKLKSNQKLRYLINIIESYFDVRKVILDKKEKRVTVVVSQGSVIGPTS